MMETLRLKNIVENWQKLDKCYALLSKESAADLLKGDMDEEYLRGLLQLIITHAKKMRTDIHMLQLSEEVNARKEMEVLLQDLLKGATNLDVTSNN
jgi:hypothetical protein